MRRILPIIFLIMLAAAVAGVLWINSLTPKIESGGVVPADVSGRIYAVDTSEYRGTNPTVGIRLRLSEDCPDLSVLIAGTSVFEVECGGAVIYSNSDSNSYEHIHVFDIPPDEVKNGSVTLIFHTEGGMGKLDMLVGSVQAIENVIRVLYCICYLAVGMSVIVLLCSLSLYLKKRSESYLLILIGLALLSLIHFVSVVPYPVITITRKTFLLIRWFSMLCQGYLCAVSCLILNDLRLPGRIGKGMLSWYSYVAAVAVFLTGTFLFIYLDLSPQTIHWSNTALRVLYAVLIAYAIWYSDYKPKPDSVVLFAGYAVCEGFCMTFDLIKVYHVEAAGVLTTLGCLYQLGCLAFMCCALVKTNIRFSGKFREAELLADELSATNRTLDAKVTQRTRQLTEQQEQKHRLMLNVFHDLRSPLFTARGCADRLSSEALRDEKTLNILKERIDFMDRLTEDLFLIAKLEAKDLLFVEDKVDFSELCQKQCDAAKLSSDGKNIALVPRIVPGLRVWGDQYRLEQAVQNLIVNAVAYTPPGGRVTVILRRESGNAVLIVQDTGKGIAPEDTDRVFTRYYRSASSENSRSTGLGLSIAYEITRMHHGSLTVESTVGKGTAFRLSLPLLE